MTGKVRVAIRQCGLCPALLFSLQWRRVGGQGHMPRAPAEGVPKAGATIF